VHNADFRGLLTRGIRLFRPITKSLATSQGLIRRSAPYWLYSLEIAAETIATKSGTVALRISRSFTQGAPAIGGLLLQFHHD
jgi:hypothetical protein